MTENFQEYFYYLKKRSIFSKAYRHYFLYPKLTKQLFGRVLDVGCGIGDMLRFRPNTVGVDINPVTIAWCRKQGLDAHQMEIDKLPFNSATFDSLVLDNVIEHIAVPDPLLTEVRRVLKPSGALLVGVPGSKGYKADSDHKVFYDVPRLLKVMKANGFECKKILHTPFKSTWLERAMRQYCIYGVFYLNHV